MTMQPEPQPPTIPEAIQIGVSHHQAGRLADAERIYRRVLEADPENREALHLLGLIAHQTGNNELAVQLIGKAILRGPAPFFLNNRAAALQQLGRYSDALADYDAALALKPDYVEALGNRGIVLQKLVRYQEALASYDQALALNPGYADASSNRGDTLQQLGRYDEALAGYGNALAIDPNHANAHFNEAQCRLLLGDFARGWKEYEWRWKAAALAAERHDFREPLWLGNENIAGKTIYLHAEQGLGDTMQFVRYAEAVARKGANVILGVQPSLKSLLTGVRGAHQVLSDGDRLPAFDFHCPLLSLPLAFDTRLETVPASIPYLHASAAGIQKWEARLGPRQLPRVGIVWSGRPSHLHDRLRSIALAELTGLAPAGIQLVSLQNEVRLEDAKLLSANPQVVHFGAELADFSDTAPLASLMDLVISVDTSVAHLAGAMGRPVWILLPFAPDFRWMLGRDDSPWYPTARLFRQRAIGDWGSVIDRVRRELARYQFG
jgi:tetratricopeptide (TPR) repeat protein